MSNCEETQIISLDDPEALEQACRFLRQGNLVVFPTDTLYGLACRPLNPAALHAIYEAKGRPDNKAIPILIAEPAQLAGFVEPVSPRAQKVMHSFWPGALTIVLPKLDGLPEELTPYPGLAVRMPAHPFALALLKRCGPLAVTSANLSNHVNTRSAQDVYKDLKGRVSLIIDGGELPGQLGSTIVDLSKETPVLLREGPLAFTEFLRIWEDAC